MGDSNASKAGRRRMPKPLDRRRLRDLALSYVARFSTSAGKLEAYLVRKVREKGWSEDGQPEIPSLVEDFIAKGYVDDRIYASARANALLARGYGARRVEQDLRGAGIEESLRGELAPSDFDARQAAAAFARRRRFGPFDTALRDDDPAARFNLREKQLAAMVRAGHDFDKARRVIEAASVGELEEWCAEAENKW